MLGGVLAIDTAKKNVRAEVASSEKLALYLFEMGQYEFDIFNIKVNRIKHYEDTLIKL